MAMPVFAQLGVIYKDEKYFDDNGKTVRHRVWEYNKENEVIKSITWVEEHNKPRTEEFVTYKRDRDGNLSKSVSIEKAAGNHEFACIQLHKTLMGRGDIIKETTQKSLTITVATLKEKKQ